MLGHLRKLASESLIYGFGSIIPQFFAIFLTPITTRVLTPGDYGVMSLVTSAMALVYTIVSSGMDTSAARWFYDTEEVQDQKVTIASWTWYQLAASFATAGCIIVAARPLSVLVMKNDHAALYLQLAAATLPLKVVFFIMTKWLRYQRLAWPTVISTAAFAILTALLTVLFVVTLRQGIAGVFLAQLVATAGVACFAVLRMRGWLSPRYFQWERFRALFFYAIPLVPASLGYWVLNVVDRYFLQHYTSSSEVGLYQMGNNVSGIVGIGVFAFTQAWVPFAYSIQKKNEAPGVYAQVFMAYTWLICLLSCGISLFALEALHILTNRAYFGAASVVGVLALGWVFEGLFYIGSIGPGIVRSTKPVGVAVILAGAFNIALNFALIPRWGMEGAAVATLISQIIRTAYIFLVAQKMYFIPYRFTPAIGLFLLASAIVWQGTFFFQGITIGTIIAKVSLLFLFFLAIPLFRIVTPEELRKILTKISSGTAGKNSTSV